MSSQKNVSLALLTRLLVGLLPGILVADLWVGWLDRASGTDEAHWLEDDYLGWVPRPGYTEDVWDTRINRFGLRNDEIPADAPEDELRILAVGASLIYGARNVRQDAVWNYQLERLLESHSPVPVRVLNGGVQGYSLTQAARRGVALLDAEVDGVELDPDVVLIALGTAVQAWVDNSGARRWVRIDGQLVDSTVIAGWPEALVPARVALHRLLMRSNLYVRHRAKLQANRGDRPAAIQGWRLSTEPVPPQLLPYLMESLDQLVQLRDACRERGIPLIALLIPSFLENSNKQWLGYTRGNAPYGAPSSSTPRLGGIGVLRDRCEALGIPSWDLTPTIEVLGTDTDRWYADDGRHWSEEGHHLVARQLARTIVEGGWLTKAAAGE